MTIKELTEKIEKLNIDENTEILIRSYDGYFIEADVDVDVFLGHEKGIKSKLFLYIG